MAGINNLPSVATAVPLTSGQASTSHGARARGPTGAGPSTVANAAADATRQQAIADIATQLHNYFPGSNGLHALVQDRAAELHDMGETPQDVAENMSKAQKMDYISEAAGNAVKAFPFAISGYASGALKAGAGVHGSTPGSEALAGAIDGATAMVMKSVGDKVFADTVKKSLWLAADPAKLEPEMQEMLEKRQGLGESLRLAPLGGQGFNGRNAVVGAVAAATHNNPQAVSHTSNVLSLAAGAAGGVLTNKFSASHGPEFLLGRTDWKAQYTALKSTSIKQQMASGGAERLKRLLLSLMTPRNYAKGALNITSGNMVSEIGALAVALAGNNALRNVVRNKGVGEAVSSAPSAAIDEALGRLGAGQLTSPSEIAKDQAINLVGAALAYAFQGIAGALAGPAPTRNDEAIDFLADKVVNSVVGEKTGEVRDKAVDMLQQKASEAGRMTVNAAVRTQEAATQSAILFANGATSTVNAVGSGLGRAVNNVSDAMSNAHQWAGEQFKRQFAASPQPTAQAMPSSAPQASSSLSVAQTPGQTTSPQTAAPARPVAQEAPQTSTSQTTAPQAAQAPTSKPAAQTAPSSAAPGGSRPAAEEIEMQPLGKSKQA